MLGPPPSPRGTLEPSSPGTLSRRRHGPPRSQSGLRPQSFQRLGKKQTVRFEGSAWSHPDTAHQHPFFSPLGPDVLTFQQLLALPPLPGGVGVLFDVAARLAKPTGATIRADRKPRGRGEAWDGEHKPRYAPPILWMIAKLISHHEGKPWLKPLFGGIYRGIIRNQGFLGGAGFRASTVAFSYLTTRSLQHEILANETNRQFQ